MTIPEGWTDDMNIELHAGTLDEVVDLVLERELAKVPSDTTIAELEKRFGLSEGDAALAWDRVMGGVVRGRTGNPAHCPAREKDPLAWESYQRVMRDPSIGARLRP